MAQKVRKLRFRGKWSRTYYGKVQVAPGPRGWKRVALYTDKTASERRLVELQREADQRRAGMETGDTEAVKRPITELRDRYISALKVERREDEHVRISGWMLDRLIELGRWCQFSDITRASMLCILKELEADGAAGGYRNTFIKRAKAFVHWLPENWPDPLRKLRRINEKGAKKNRARFAASPQQVVDLLNSEIADYRKDCYALMALNSLRRNEAEALVFAGDNPDAPGVHLDAEIPYMGIARKNGEDDTLEYIPIHPYLVRRFREREVTAGTRVIRNVPDVSTLERDWKRIGIPFVNDRGERLDIHALRWTFRTNLGRANCSRVTIKNSCATRTRT